jgi:hypothetical protein
MYWITGIVGFILMVAPFIVGYTDVAPAFWSSIALGLVVAFVSGYKVAVKDIGKWEALVSLAAGVITILVPFGLSFSATREAMWTSIVLGAVITLLSGYQVLFEEPTAS